MQLLSGRAAPDPSAGLRAALPGLTGAMPPPTQGPLNRGLKRGKPQASLPVIGPQPSSFLDGLRGSQ